MNWPHFFDLERQIADGYGIWNYPTFVVIDHQGVVRWIGPQFHDQLIEELIKKAEAA